MQGAEHKDWLTVDGCVFAAMSQYGAVPEINGAQAQAKSAYGSLVSDDELKGHSAASASEASPAVAAAARVASPPAGAAEDVDDWIELTHAASGRKYYQSVRERKRERERERERKLFGEKTFLFCV